MFLIIVCCVFLVFFQLDVYGIAYGMLEFGILVCGECWKSGILELCNSGMWEVGSLKFGNLGFSQFGMLSFFFEVWATYY